MIATVLDAGQQEAVALELGAEFCTDRSVPRPVTSC